ncbi:MAG: hypothetical protein M3A24_05525 [Candidatus Rhabdochlamydia oedothoracis]|nr:hypothetical protein [Candidatus Rhabdochlamydia oedothoracis]
MRLYHKNDPCLDKAGGYGIQDSTKHLDPSNYRMLLQYNGITD